MNKLLNHDFIVNEIKELIPEAVLSDIELAWLAGYYHSEYTYDWEYALKQAKDYETWLKNCNKDYDTMI